jgi:hypothetical protein
MSLRNYPDGQGGYTWQPPVQRLIDEAAARPGWSTSGTALAQKKHTILGRYPTDQVWAILESSVRWDGIKGAYRVSVHRWWTTNGYAERRFWTIAAADVAAGPAAALALADRMLAAVRPRLTAGPDGTLILSETAPWLTDRDVLSNVPDAEIVREPDGAVWSLTDAGVELLAAVAGAEEVA